MDEHNYNPYAKKAVFHDEPYQKPLIEILDKYGAYYVHPLTFYMDIFPPETIQSGDRADKGDGHIGNPLVMIKKTRRGEGGKLKEYTIHRVMHNDYSELLRWKQMQNVQHVYCSGLTYLGKKRTLSNAVAMHAMIIDIDYVGSKELDRLLYGMQNDIYPMANYVVLSGGGIHLYYVFEEPIILYHGKFGKKIKAQVNMLKMALIKQLWNPNTVGGGKGNDPQFQGINQPYRMPGTFTKSFGFEHDRYVCTAYKLREQKFQLADLYDYILDEDLEGIEKYKAKYSQGLDFWKEANPEWYQRRIVEQDNTVKYWHVNRNVYDWWLKQVLEKARHGHRYYCLWLTVIYAVKCDIPLEEVKRDMIEKLLPQFELLKPDDPITLEEVDEALQSYIETYNTFPKGSIEFFSGIKIESTTRRNGRTQKEHLKRARAMRDISLAEQGRSFTDGRPDVSKKVMAWQRKHPSGSKAQCIRDTGLSKPTVYKWWNYEEKLNKEQINSSLMMKIIRSKGWHEELPKYYVVAGSSNMAEQMQEFANKGIRQVEILDKTEEDILLFLKDFSFVNLEWTEEDENDIQALFAELEIERNQIAEYNSQSLN